MAFRVTRSTTIDRPIEDVFATLTNVENMAMWFPAKVKESWTSDPPLGVGSTRHAEITMGWFRSQNDAVVTEYEPPRHAAMKGISKGAPFEATYNFKRVGGATRVEATTELFLRGPLRLLGPVLVRWFGRSWERGLVRFRALMESREL